MDGYSVLMSLIMRMSVITLCVLAIKAVFKSKLSAKVHMLMWIIVCVQLVFCIGNVKIQNSVSIYNAVPQSVYHTPAEASGNFTDMAVRIWILGSVLLAVWYLLSFILYRFKIRKYPLVTDVTSSAMMCRVKRIIGISENERITVRCGETAQTMPHTVILPRGFCEEEMYWIILHELCHYKYKDYIKLWIGLGVLCINWFNPLIWYSFYVFRTDIEMLCDDRVLKLTEDKKEYARVLVKSASVRSRFVPGAAAVNNGKGEVTKRIKRIAALKKHTPAWLFVCGFVCLTACCVCLTDAVTVAVENTIEIIPTPVPVTATAIPQATPEAVPQPVATAAPSEKPVYRTAAENTPSTAYREAYSSVESTENIYDENTSYAPTEESVPTAVPDTETAEEIPAIGSDRESVYSVMGSPDSVSGGGTKETYELEDGSTAIVQYDGDKFTQGYIVEND